jgi:hypothetical protein
MKIELEVPDELITQLGKEAVVAYLERKAEALHQSIIKRAAEEDNSSADKEATEDAWQKFNKRGMSC